MRWAPLAHRRACFAASLELGRHGVDQRRRASGLQEPPRASRDSQGLVDHGASWSFAELLERTAPAPLPTQHQPKLTQTLAAEARPLLETANTTSDLQCSAHSCYYLLMRAGKKPVERSRQTFTEAARRTQIVDAAIDTIAEVGYARASFALIAKRAGLSSTGLISYHFASKDDLIEQVVTTIISLMGQFMAQRMEHQSSAAGALRTYIHATAAFIGTHRAQMKALLDIFLNGGLHYDETTELVVVSPVEEILRRGQQSGEFRTFDTRVMAVLIQRAVDGLPFLLATYPDVDVEAYAREVVTIFDLATRRTER